MVRPFALLGFSAYGALALCAALGPDAARPLGFLCLGLACAIALGRAVLGFFWGRRGIWTENELSGETPRALSAFRSLFWAAAAIALAGAACVLYLLAWQQAAPWQGLDGEKLQVRAQVLDYPEERYHRYYYKLRVEALRQEEGALEAVGPFTLRLSSTMPLACDPYDRVECLVTFQAFEEGGGLYSTRNARLADGFQAGAYLSQYGGIAVEGDSAVSPGEMLVQLRHQVGRAMDRLLPRREAGLLRAMVLGDSGGVSEEDMSRFRQLGVSHILVVSGLHMTILAGFMQFLLCRFPIRKAVRNALTALVLVLFLALSGFQPSACRGAAMYGVLLLADSTGRRADSLNSLGLAVLLVCLFAPFSGGDLGFALSVLATLGIVVLYRPVYQALVGKRLAGLARRLWKPVAASLAVTAAALLGTFPVQLAVFGGLPLLTPLANLLLVFPSTLLLYASFCGAFLSLLPATAPLAAPFVWAAGWLARLLLGAAGLLAQWKGTFLPLTGEVALAVVIGLLLLLMAAGLVGQDRPLRAVLGGCMAVLAVFGGVFQGWLTQDTVIFAAPAAEESSCVVMIQDGKAAVLSFGGYRTGAVAELLQRYRVTQVEALCLPDRGPEAREAAVQVLEEYGAKQLVLPGDAYVGRDLELALGDALPVFLEGGDSVSLWAGVSAQVLPQWEGLLLSVYGVEVLVEWGPGQSRNCGLLFTNQPQTRVNAPLSVWQTDGIIGENGQGLAFSPEGEGAVLPVEEGCVEVSVSPEGTVSVRREG